MANVPQPPRRSGNAQQDLVSFQNYVHDLYKALVLDGELLAASEQVIFGTFDPASLPDPASTTLAQAQQTANEAYTLAASNDARLDAQDAGQVTLSELETSKAVTFTTAQADTSYFIVLTPTAESGAPAAGARDVVTVAKTTTGFTVTVNAAPGAGTSVTYDWILRR